MQVSGVRCRTSDTRYPIPDTATYWTTIVPWKRVFVSSWWSW